MAKKNHYYNSEKKRQRLKRFLHFKYGGEVGEAIFKERVHQKSLWNYRIIYGKLNGVKEFEKWRELNKSRGTLDFYIKKYGREIGLVKYKEKNSKLSISVEALRRAGRSELEIEQIRSKHAKNSQNSKENFIKRYGVDNGPVKYEKSVKNRTSVRTVAGLMKIGLSEDVAKNKLAEVQRRDLPFFIRKYGVEKGTLKYKEACRKKAFGGTLEFFIQKYGEKEGIKRYKERIARVKYAQTEDYYIAKYGEKEGKERYKSVLIKKASGFIDRNYSNIQLEFSKLLYKNLPKEYQEVFRGIPITTGVQINFPENIYKLRYCLPDVLIDKIIVEFDGDYWHQLSDVIEKDKKKTFLLANLGYSIIRAQEYDFRHDPINTVNKTITAIKQIYEN